MTVHPISILLIDGADALAAGLADLIDRNEFRLEAVSDGQEVRNLLAHGEYDILITNIGSPGSHDFSLIDFINSRNLDTAVIIISETLSHEGAVESIKRGAFDYFEKPVVPEALLTSVKRAQEKLALQNENKRIVCELQKLNSMKNEFLSILSHDIRSPLSSIGGFAGYLLKKGSLTDLQQHYLEIIHQISENLYSLVNEVLDISKIEKGIIELDREETNLEEIVNSSINNFILLAVDKNNRIEFYNSLADMMLQVDRMKLLQVFNNLISNANKFTEDGKIVISLGEEQNGEISISVRDTGIGMDESELTQLFDQYRYYHRSGTRGEKGNGLGIIICRQFIELHGGRLEVTSEKGKGSRFTILLPGKSVTYSTS